MQGARLGTTTRQDQLQDVVTNEIKESRATEKQSVFPPYQVEPDTSAEKAISRKQSCKLQGQRPVALEDGLSRQHGSNSGGLRQAAQLGCSNEGTGQAGVQGQGHHLAAQGGYPPINVQRIKNPQLLQGTLQSLPLQQ